MSRSKPGAAPRVRMRRLALLMRKSYVICVLGPAAAIAVGIVLAPTAAAGCNSSGAATVCAQGEVRGGPGPTPVSTYDPYQCSDPYLCYYDTYDPLIVVDPDWGIELPIGGGGRPGGGGGIRPR
ncbi:MAG: hypothetical protein QOH54_6330 [Mycobacterium sp.]|jgi:hypothetical protein|nr:hypothetical protein [Mycobacterium sp.]MDT5241961.1 hypothetical protein [Mycobacterium sp.]